MATLRQTFSGGVPPRFSARKVSSLLTTDETENIWDAARHANVHRVEQLLSAGTSANTQDREGVSPLSWAAHAQADGVVELLLRRRDLVRSAAAAEIRPFGDAHRVALQ